MELEILKDITKLPFAWNNTFYHSKRLPQNKHCLKCEAQDCLSLVESNDIEYVCKLGFNCFVFRVSEGKVIFNGLITTDNKVIKEGRRIARTDYVIDRQTILDYLQELGVISSYIDDGIKKNIQDKFTLFHDVRTSYAIAFSNLEALILEQKGNSFQEKLQNCDHKIVDLYDSLDLVTSQIDLIDVMINPAVISQGTKREINIFRLTHKLVKLFSIKAEKRDLDLEYRSNKTIPSGLYHDSLKLVPIILIENAIKYSEPGNKVLITIDFINEKVKFSISTYGLKVPDDERGMIFEKQKRGRNASQYTDEGLGMGLYIAKRILLEHAGNIAYSFESKNGWYGFNVFTFEV
jgi:signal transduction histidine kinase